MKLNKYSLESDKIANLYRAAFYLASGDQVLATNFIIKTDFPELLPKTNLNYDQQRLWAEKILDKYHQLLLA